MGKEKFDSTIRSVYIRKATGRITIKKGILHQGQKKEADFGHRASGLVQHSTPDIPQPKIRTI